MNANRTRGMHGDSILPVAEPLAGAQIDSAYGLCWHASPLVSLREREKDSESDLFDSLGHC